MSSTQRRVITRNRESLACTECRRRKLKCDRHSPCTSCAKRGDGASCAYRRLANGLEHEHGRRVHAEERLEHLERLVQELAQHGDASAPRGQTLSQVVDQPASQAGSNGEHQVRMSDAIVYNGSTHWSAMLEDIQGLRSTITSGEAITSDDDRFESEENIATSLILGAAAPLSLQQLLAQYLPVKHEADGLIAAYFRSGGISAPSIHASCFQRQYQEFWKDPPQAPALWISILFSICHIAKSCLTVHGANEYPEDKYIVASARCLTLGEYFRPKKHAVESLLLFAQAKCVTGPSMSPDTDLICGLLVRLATKMGYHRDPEIFRLSAFEKEMRRRTWSLCMQLDLLVSFQLGVPSNVQYPTWDTQPPRNLYDSDFDEDVKELPPARPDTESTDITFYIAKHRLMAVFEKILRHNLATGTDGTTDVDRLDIEIRDVYSALPKILRPRFVADSVVDSPSLIVTRLCVFFLFQKSLCVLHRPYVAQGRVHSIQVCHEAASNIVHYFLDIYKEFFPGGQMEGERWLMGSITWNDYLLGIMALCLALCANSQHIAGLTLESQNTFQLLERARDVCNDQSARRKDGGRVQKVVEATLLRFGALESRSNGYAMNHSDSSTSPLNPSLMQSSSFGDHASDLDVARFDVLQDCESEQMVTNWAESDGTATSTDEASWAYLEQFLNLSDGDVVRDM